MKRRFPVRTMILSGILACGLFSCASAPVVIPDNLTPSELIQRAQDATDQGKSDAAVQYYSAILERFPQDYTNVCAAEYEIGFIRFKQKRYDEARALFAALLKRYEDPDAQLLPAQYRILAQKILDKIPAAKGATAAK